MRSRSELVLFGPTFPPPPSPDPRVEKSDPHNNICESATLHFSSVGVLKNVMIQTRILVLFLMRIHIHLPSVAPHKDPWSLVDSLLLLCQDKQNRPVISSVTDPHSSNLDPDPKICSQSGLGLYPAKSSGLYRIKKRSFDILTLSLCSRKCRKHGELPPS